MVKLLVLGNYSSQWRKRSRHRKNSGWKYDR